MSDVAVSIADGATATAASAVDTGMDVDADPSPAGVALPTAEQVSSFYTYGGVRMIWRPVRSWMLLLIRALMWLWARLLVSPSLWSPLAPPPTWMSTLQMIYLLMLPTLIQPRSGVVMMRPQQRCRFLVLLLLRVPPNPRPRPTFVWISA